jgi:hypothetical protein
VTWLLNHTWKWLDTQVSHLQATTSIDNRRTAGSGVFYALYSEIRRGKLARR